jgi:hypothetical protein
MKNEYDFLTINDIIEDVVNNYTHLTTKYTNKVKPIGLVKVKSLSDYPDDNIEHGGGLFFWDEELNKFVLQSKSENNVFQVIQETMFLNADGTGILSYNPINFIVRPIAFYKPVTGEKTFEKFVYTKETRKITTTSLMAGGLMTVLYFVKSKFYDGKLVQNLIMDQAITDTSVNLVSSYTIEDYFQQQIDSRIDYYKIGDQDLDYTIRPKDGDYLQFQNVNGYGKWRPSYVEPPKWLPEKSKPVYLLDKNRISIQNVQGASNGDYSGVMSIDDMDYHTVTAVEPVIFYIDNYNPSHDYHFYVDFNHEESDGTSVYDLSDREHKISNLISIRVDKSVGKVTVIMLDNITIAERTTFYIKTHKSTMLEKVFSDGSKSIAEFGSDIVAYKMLAKEYITSSIGLEIDTSHHNPGDKNSDNFYEFVEGDEIKFTFNTFDYSDFKLEFKEHEDSTQTFIPAWHTDYTIDYDNGVMLFKVPPGLYNDNLKFKIILSRSDTFTTELGYVYTSKWSSETILVNAVTRKFENRHVPSISTFDIIEGDIATINTEFIDNEDLYTDTDFVFNAKVITENPDGDYELNKYNDNQYVFRSTGNTVNDTTFEVAVTLAFVGDYRYEKEEIVTINVAKYVAPDIIDTDIEVLNQTTITDYTKDGTTQTIPTIVNDLNKTLKIKLSGDGQKAYRYRADSNNIGSYLIETIDKDTFIYTEGSQVTFGEEETQYISSNVSGSEITFEYDMSKIISSQKGYIFKIPIQRFVDNLGINENDYIFEFAVINYDVIPITIQSSTGFDTGTITLDENETFTGKITNYTDITDRYNNPETVISCQITNDISTSEKFDITLNHDDGVFAIFLKDGKNLHTTTDGSTLTLNLTIGFEYSTDTNFKLVNSEDYSFTYTPLDDEILNDIVVADKEEKSNFKVLTYPYELNVIDRNKINLENITKNQFDVYSETLGGETIDVNMNIVNYGNASDRELFLRKNSTLYIDEKKDFFDYEKNKVLGTALIEDSIILFYSVDLNGEDDKFLLSLYSIDTGEIFARKDITSSVTSGVYTKVEAYGNTGLTYIKDNDFAIYSNNFFIIYSLDFGKNGDYDFLELQKIDTKVDGNPIFDYGSRQCSLTYSARFGTFYFLQTLSGETLLRDDGVSDVRANLYSWSYRTNTDKLIKFENSSFTSPSMRQDITDVVIDESVLYIDSLTVDDKSGIINVIYSPSKFMNEFLGYLKIPTLNGGIFDESNIEKGLIFSYSGTSDPLNIDLVAGDSNSTLLQKTFLSDLEVGELNTSYLLRGERSLQHRRTIKSVDSKIYIPVLYVGHIADSIQNISEDKSYQISLIVEIDLNSDIFEERYDVHMLPRQALHNYGVNRWDFDYHINDNQLYIYGNHFNAGIYDDIAFGSLSGEFNKSYTKLIIYNTENKDVVSHNINLHNNSSFPYTDYKYSYSVGVVAENEKSFSFLILDERKTSSSKTLSSIGYKFQNKTSLKNNIVYFKNGLKNIIPKYTPTEVISVGSSSYNVRRVKHNHNTFVSEITRDLIRFYNGEYTNDVFNGNNEVQVTLITDKGQKIDIGQQGYRTDGFSYYTIKYSECINLNLPMERLFVFGDKTKEIQNNIISVDNGFELNPEHAIQYEIIPDNPDIDYNGLVDLKLYNSFREAKTNTSANDGKLVSYEGTDYIKTEYQITFDMVIVF